MSPSESSGLGREVGKEGLMSLVFRGPDEMDVSFHVNGRQVRVWVEPRRTLLSVLREELGLTGATCPASISVVSWRLSAASQERL